MPSKSKPRSAGGGRTSNSEPRVQVFRDFGGCNFQLMPRDFNFDQPYFEEQSDLQMNYFSIQNNVGVVDNKTIETRNDIQALFTPPSGRKFTDACILIGDELYIGLDNGDLAYGTLGSNSLSLCTLNNLTGSTHHWKSFTYVDDKIVATTLENQLWTGVFGTHTLENAKRVPNPPAPTISNLTAKGKLRISATLTTECPFRVAIAWSHVNKYGPTACSNQFTFYANYPVDEWSGAQYLRISGTAPTSYNIKAVEIYYTVGNSSSLLFAGRTDFSGGDGGNFNFDWFGYLDATSMWPMANLLSPTENVTEGVKASHVTCIDSRLYFWGNSTYPYRLWIGGNPGNLFSISPGTGGGFVDVEPGTGQEIRVVTKYKTQSGASIVTMLCDSENSAKEQRYNLVENSVTISNEQSMKSWQAEQVAGAVGCKSYHGAVVCEDGLYSISRYGLALTTMTMEYNSQIRVNHVSNSIKPAFIDNYGRLLKDAVLLECDGVIYMSLGQYGGIDSLIFCYDIDLKAWWTIVVNSSDTILNMVHIDYENYREGIGFITESSISMLPLTIDDDLDTYADHDFVIETGELSTTQPMQNWFYLSQLEFRFDYFIGNITIELIGIDQFGRKVKTVKNISHDTLQHNLTEWMRIDLRLQSYELKIYGDDARFRLTHFMARVYPISSKHGMVWGFNDSQSSTGQYDIHPTFKDYNDIRKAIIP